MAGSIPTGKCVATNNRVGRGYDGASHLTSLTAQNTSNLSLLNDSFGYGYDHVGWTTSINTTLTGGTNSSLTLAHDALGRLVSQTGTPTGSWVYDGRNNLSSSTVNGGMFRRDPSTFRPRCTLAADGERAPWYNRLRMLVQSRVRTGASAIRPAVGTEHAGGRVATRNGWPVPPAAGY